MRIERKSNAAEVLAWLSRVEEKLGEGFRWTEGPVWVKEGGYLLFSDIPPNWIPNPAVWENYPDSLQALPFGRAYWNSFYIAAIVVTSQLLTCSMAAYAFARIDFPFRDTIFIIFLGTLMLSMGQLNAPEAMRAFIEGVD